MLEGAPMTNIISPSASISGNVAAGQLCIESDP
jgi:hypothetical protein